MKSHTLRLYVVSITLLVFFVLWAVIAARPWARASASAPAIDPRLAALNRRARQLQHEAHVVNQLLAHRWSAYQKRLRERHALIHRLEQRHAQQVAAAAQAQAQAQQSSSAAAAPPVTASASAAPASRVVTLAPQVKVVTLPPAAAATSSGSSHP